MVAAVVAVAILAGIPIDRVLDLAENKHTDHSECTAYPASNSSYSSLLPTLDSVHRLEDYWAE